MFLAILQKLLIPLGAKTIKKNGIEKSCFDEAQEIFFKSASLKIKARRIRQRNSMI